VDDRGLGPEYVYLLGLYLGDGMLTAAPRNVWRLRISLDAKYPGIVSQASEAIAEVAVREAGRVPRPGCVEVFSNWKHWLCVFPQHGAGPKHLRPIRLAAWQRRLVATFPEPFLRGLIHSDGCRITNRVLVRGKWYAYPRYFFSNTSADIRELFSQTCTAIGVDWRNDGPKNISVARRRSVERLDMFIGPKA